MCWMCDESEDGLEQSCQDCGRLICFDTKAEDDICAPAGASASGDLYCLSCARGHDEAEEEEYDEYAAFDDPIPEELMRRLDE